MTVSSNGMVALSSEASESLTKFKYDIYEDEDTMQIKFQENKQGEVTLRRASINRDKRFLFSRSKFLEYLKQKYEFNGSVKLMGERVEDGFIFDLTTARELPKYPRKAKVQ